MATKKYISNASISFPITVGKNRKFISLETNRFIIYKKEEWQKAIEESKYFKKGIIVCVDEIKESDTDDELLKEDEAAHLAAEEQKQLEEENEKKLAEEERVKGETEAARQAEEERVKLEAEEEAKSPAEKSAEIIVLDGVTSYQQAKEILRGAPYNIAFQSLNTPENIIKKAAKAGVSFPNLSK